MRKTTDRLREQAKAAADDRDLTSRSDLRRAENDKEDKLKRLAQSLVDLKPAQLDRLQLDAELMEAVLHAKSLGDRRAQSRQIGVVRQHLRSQADIGKALGERVEALKAGLLPSVPRPAPAPKVGNARLESWIDRFVNDGEAALEEFFGTYPEADRQTLRQSTRLVARARDSGASTTASSRAESRLRAELARWL
jgi:ribosome-associated protein